jgi:tetratricopeptide (TPR) repeat protein
MRSLIFAAGIAAIVIPLGAAQGAVLTLGGPLSRLCYQSALGQDGRASAIEGCSRALQEEGLNPRDRAATLVNRGILKMVAGQGRDADTDFDAALAINPDLADAWLNKGFLRLRRGDGREALPLLEQGISRNPERQALAFFARGVAYEQMGEFRSAYVDLKRAHQLEPRWSLPSEYLERYQIVRR